MSKTTETIELEHKGRKITIHTECTRYGLNTYITHGYWKYNHEGEEYGVNIRLHGEQNCHAQMTLAKDVMESLDDPAGYARSKEEAERKVCEAEAQARAEGLERDVCEREEDAEYRGIVDLAVVQFGEGVESYLQDVWAMCMEER